MNIPWALLPRGTLSLRECAPTQAQAHSEAQPLCSEPLPVAGDVPTPYADLAAGIFTRRSDKRVLQWQGRPSWLAGGTPEEGILWALQ